jgi:hypothetical protein
MKKISSLLLVVTITASSFATPVKPGFTPVKKVISIDNVTSLKIYNNVEVVLTEDDNNEIRIVGEDLDVENTSVRMIHGELIISSSSHQPAKEKVVVYVPSQSLNSVSVHGASIVSSQGVLNNRVLDITINGEGTTNIRTSGNINVNTIADYPLAAY